MNLSDPIADMFTRIRNASNRRHADVLIPMSAEKMRIASLLKKEGFIESVDKTDNERIFLIKLKYYDDKETTPVVRTIRRVSKPGLRQYTSYKKLNPVLHGQGIYIVSTSKGIISDNDCRTEKVGGEILGMVY